MAPITKWSDTLKPDGVLQVMVRALHEATHSRPGPVHVDCPGDVAGSPMTMGFDNAFFEFEVQGPSAEDRSRLEALLASARKPLLLVGLGARGGADAAAIRSLCAARRIPAMVTYGEGRRP
jgi:acetolactate synthase I/II/III large subunit